MQRHQVEFRGQTGEYFGIWIVNVLLSIITLGIYGAWAKVRDKKYMYGSTFIDCLLYTSPSPRDRTRSRMPSSA